MCARRYDYDEMLVWGRPQGLFRGWGAEADELHTAFTAHPDYTAFRPREPGFVHDWHPPDRPCVAPPPGRAAWAALGERRRRRRWPWRRARRRTRPGRSAAAAVVDARVVPRREWCIWGGRWSGGRRVGIHGWARVPARRRRSREAAAASSVAVEKGGRHRAGVIQTKSEGRGVIRHGSPRLHNNVTTHEAKGAVLDQLSKPTRSLPFRSTSLNTHAIRACRAIHQRISYYMAQPPTPADSLRHGALDSHSRATRRQRGTGNCRRRKK